MGVSLTCEQDGPASCLSYSTQCTSATIGVRLPNAATGSLDGGMYQVSVGRTNNGTGTFQYTQTSGWGSPA